MENKTKEQLAEEYAKKMNGENCSNLFPDLDDTIGEICKQDFIAGWDARQAEIDYLKKIQ